MKRSSAPQRAPRFSRAKPLRAPATRASALIAKLRDVYPTPSWGVFSEVRSSVAPYEVLRRADAIALRLAAGDWNVVGFEVKTSRADWLRELRDPAKSGPFQAFCSAWYVVVPAPWKRIVLSTAELPEGWGLVEVGTGAPLVVVRALERDAEPPEPDFLRALLRSALARVDEDLDAGDVPLVRINRGALSRVHVGLECGHVVPRPLDKVVPLALPCHACAEGRPTDHEYLEAALLDETRADRERLRELLLGRAGERGGAA